MGIEKPQDWKDFPPQPELQIIPSEKQRTPEISPAELDEIIKKMPEESEDETGEEKMPTLH